MRKDIIEDIKYKLKQNEDFAYREGAWEKFAKQQNIHSTKPIVSIKYWASAAAAILLVATYGTLYLYKSDINKNERTPQAVIALTQPTNKQSQSIDSNNITKDNTNSLHSHATESSQEYVGSTVDPDLVAFQKLSVNNSVALLDINDSPANLQLASLENIIPKIIHRQMEPAIPIVTNFSHNIHAFASERGQLTQNASSSTEKSISPKLFTLGNKFQLGLYVSPFKTSDQFDVGAGILLSYTITNKISVRTGTSYNSYTVGVLKDPLESSIVETVEAAEMPLSGHLADKNNIASNKMILPNINAVLGKVEAMEVPLDVTYHFNKNFYTSAGVSLSVIINQERQAQYVENGGYQSLKSNEEAIADAARATNSNQIRTIKSAENNVNPDGFSGFANFSIGKKLNVNKKMSLSLEPYIKVPVGQFRKSDLDYTNSGIRIITSF